MKNVHIQNDYSWLAFSNDNNNNIIFLFLVGGKYYKLTLRAVVRNSLQRNSNSNGNNGIMVPVLLHCRKD